MFCGLGTVGGGAGSFQLFKRFVFARNDDLRQGKVPVLKPRRLQFDAEPSGDFGLAQAHLLDFPPIELQPFQAVVQFQNKVNVFVSLMTVTDALNEPARIHNMIYKLIRDMNANAVLKQIKEIDDFDEKYAKGRRLGYFR